MDAVEAMIDLALERDMDRFFFHPIANENQELALELIKHPQAVVTFSDSGVHVSQLMDSSLPTYLLSHWVRARQALTLEQAVRKMTAMPAARLRLVDRGRIAPNLAEDLVVFDPATVIDKATYEEPFQYPEGIPAVVVNGRIALRDGDRTKVAAGRTLRAGD